jgi:hypothetical protein
MGRPIRCTAIVSAHSSLPRAPINHAQRFILPPDELLSWLSCRRVPLVCKNSRLASRQGGCKICRILSPRFEGVMNSSTVRSIAVRSIVLSCAWAVIFCSAALGQTTDCSTRCGSRLLVGPLALKFPPQVIHTHSSPLTILVRSVGILPAPIVIKKTGSSYAQTNNCPSSLPNGKACQIKVTFTPKAIGTLLGTVTIDTSYVVNLSGTGTTP